MTDNHQPLTTTGAHLCPGHGTELALDMFGNLICPDCLESEKQLAELRESAVCPNCGDGEHLTAELIDGHGDQPDRIMNIWCDACSTYVWIAPGVQKLDYDALAYLLPGGGLDYDV